MLVIRFRRIGKKNKPTYRLTVAEHTKPVNGSFVSDVGFYNPHTKIAGLKGDEILEWLKKGAKPSNTVARLLQREKIKHASIVVVKKNKKAKTDEKKADERVSGGQSRTEANVVATLDSSDSQSASEPEEETPPDSPETETPDSPVESDSEKPAEEKAE